MRTEQYSIVLKRILFLFHGKKLDKLNLIVSLFLNQTYFLLTTGSDLSCLQQGQISKQSKFAKCSLSQNSRKWRLDSEFIRIIFSKPPQQTRLTVSVGGAKNCRIMARFPFCTTSKWPDELLISGVSIAVASQQIWSCYVNFPVFADCKNNRILKKWIMVIF